MARKEAKKYKYCASGTLSTGENFEKDTPVGDIPKEDLAALIEMNAVVEEV